MAGGNLIMAALSLSNTQITKIRVLIESWGSKFTWDLLVARIDSDLDIQTTRQTLNEYKSIKEAYLKKKSELRGVVSKEFIVFTKADLDSFNTIKDLKAENKVLKDQVDSQLAFIREVARQSESNPLLTHLLNKVRKSLTKAT